MTLLEPGWQGAATQTMHTKQQLVCARVLQSCPKAFAAWQLAAEQRLCPRRTRGQIYKGRAG